jgi:phosphoribosylaminoimidazole carboxylase PurE protein
MEALVGVIAGSKSDIPKLEKGFAVFDELGIAYRTAICSAHRDPERLKATIAEWESEGVAVFIAAAGLAAHLPGVVASHTLRPVIGVPLDAALSGLDSLLSIVQMPPGIPVATVGVGNIVNAVVLSAEIIALSDSQVAERLAQMRGRAREKAREDDSALPQ